MSQEHRKAQTTLDVLAILWGKGKNDEANHRAVALAKVYDKLPHAARQSGESLSEQKGAAWRRQTSTSATPKVTRLGKSISAEVVAAQFAVI